MIKKQYLLFLLVAFSINVFAQKEAKMKADKAYDHLSYLKAADLYQQLGEGGMDAVTKAKLADSYRLNGDTESAEYWYAQSAKDTGNPEDLLHYAQTLQSNGKCETALQWYDQYRGLMGNENPVPRATVTDCSKIAFLPKERVYVRNMPALNSGHLDYSPIPYKGGIVFTSTRGKQEQNLQDQWTKDNFSDLFYAQKIGKESFSNVQLLEGNINGHFHDGVATFTASGNKMYFSRSNEKGKNSKSIVDLKIYSADLQDQKWVNVQELSFNNKEFSTCHPTLSADGNTLYFSSNRPGGFGGMDIYRSTRSGSVWSTPENLGAAVNTSGNEIFPFVDKLGVIYFASDGLLGVGGLDIYQTQWKGDNWIPAENMGEPINSPKDDFGYAVLENQEEGYFTSNRNGGQGGDDIYYWTTEYTNEGNAPQNIISVIDEVSGERIEEAMVTIVEGVYTNTADMPAGKKVKDDGTNPAEYRVQPISFLTDKKGKVSPDVRSGKTYTILVEKPGYTQVKKVVNAYDLMRTPEWIVPINKRKGLSLKGSIVNERYNHFVPNANVELFNLCTGEYEKILSDDKGNFEFFLDCNCDYELVGKKERFSQDKKKYSTIGMDCQTAKPINSILYLKAAEEMTTTRTVPAPPVVNVKPTPAPVEIISEPIITRTEPIYEVGQVITLDNVYYDFNKATIRGDASEELDKIVELLNQYPSMEIQLASHTDSRGDVVYNENLSEERAASAVNYITSRGIATSRITGKGYGEWLLKNDCKDGVKCSDAQHQENRRTEVKITKLTENVEVRYKK